MKLAIITDIHHAPSQPGGLSILPVVADFVARANAAGADLLIDLGDRIDDFDRGTDLALATELAEIFHRFEGRRVHLQGNHDVVNLTEEDQERLLGRRRGHVAIDLGGVRLLVWEPDVRLERGIGFPPAAGELEWLTTELNSDLRPALIATHIPFSGASMAGNYYFENNPDYSVHPDHAFVRAAVEATGAAAIWLSGHVHWNSLTTVGNVRHLVVQSTSETFTTAPHPACATAMLEIADGSARLEVSGNDPLSLAFPFQRSDARRWPQPRPKVS